MTERFQLDAGDGHSIHGISWQPDGPAVAVVQVIHGLAEHAGRYADFAAAAVGRGYAVVAHDHRGHGAHADPVGHFADRNGWQTVLADIHRVNRHVQATFPGCRVGLLGHSMGSFLAQTYAMHYSGLIAALIVSGSTWPSRLELLPGHLLARAECLRVGKRGYSRVLHALFFGSFNRRFRPARTDYDWLSRDDKEVDAYIADPLCGRPYTAGLVRDLTGGLLAIASEAAINRIPGEMPVLISGGSVDPVGGESGMGRLALHYAQTQHSRLKVKIFDGARHELLHETNRDEVTSWWLDWLEPHLKPRS